MECSVEGCGRVRDAGGMCNMHYRRLLWHPKRRELRVPRPCENPDCDELVQPPARGPLGKFCSAKCRQALRPTTVPKTKIDYQTIEGIRRETLEDPVSGCWLWQRHIGRDGYARGSTGTIHRLVAIMRYGDLDGQAVHHKCGVTFCVNPDHLQPISRRENAAEMLLRNYYLDRIRRLEEALAEWAPLHPLLVQAA